MKTKMGLYLSIFTILTLTASIGIGQEATGKLGQSAAPLKDLQWVKGSPVTFETGKVYVVEFWATWCPPCRKSIPHLTELQHQFKDKNVTIIGISTETADTVKPFVEEKADEMDYTVAIDTEKTASNAYMKAFGVRGIPHAFIVDSKGNLAWHGHPMDGMDGVLEAVLAGNFDSAAYAEKKAAEEAEQAKMLNLFRSYFKAVETDSNDIAEVRQQLIETPNAVLLNALAWNILTKVAEEKRDLEFAYQASAKAVKLTEEKDAGVIDTYALAMYELGKKYVVQAATYQKKAISLVDTPQAKESFQKALDRYESASVE